MLSRLGPDDMLYTSGINLSLLSEEANSTETFTVRRTAPNQMPDLQSQCGRSVFCPSGNHAESSMLMQMPVAAVVSPSPCAKGPTRPAITVVARTSHALRCTGTPAKNCAEVVLRHWHLVVNVPNKPSNSTLVPFAQAVDDSLCRHHLLSKSLARSPGEQQHVDQNDEAPFDGMTSTSAVNLGLTDDQAHGTRTKITNKGLSAASCHQGAQCLASTTVGPCRMQLTRSRGTWHIMEERAWTVIVACALQLGNLAPEGNFDAFGMAHQTLPGELLGFCHHAIA